MNAQNIRDYNFTLSANSTQNLDVPGDYLKVISATGAIRVRTVEGWMKDLLPGQGVKGLNFQRLILEDRSGAANTGTIAVGIGADSIVDDRITGNVGVIDVVAPSCQAVQTIGGTSIGVAADTVIAPAAGVSLLIRSTVLTSLPGAGGTLSQALIAAPTAPTAFTANPGVMLNRNFNDNSSNARLNLLTDQRRQLPAGWGLYLVRNAAIAVANSNVAEVSYEFA